MPSHFNGISPFPYFGPIDPAGLQRFGWDQLICECHWEPVGRGWCRGRGGAGIYFDHQHHQHHELGCLERQLHVWSSGIETVSWTRRWNWGIYLERASKNSKRSNRKNQMNQTSINHIKKFKKHIPAYHRWLHMALNCIMAMLETLWINFMLAKVTHDHSVADSVR